MKGCRAFVTGGSGAVGRNLLPLLIDSGMKLRVLKHNAPLPGVDAEEVVGDIRNFQEGWLEGVDVVFHLAAKTIPSGKDGSMTEVNAGGTERLVRALQSVGRSPRLVFASSIAVFGPCRNGLPLSNDSPLNPISDYGRSKLKAEAAVLGYERAVIVRLPMVVGPGDRVTGRFEKLARTRVFPVTPKRFCTIDARDAARLFCHLAKAADAEGRIHTVSDGESYSWRDVARHFGELRGRGVFAFTIPGILLRPALFGLLGNPDGAYYLKYDWICRPNFPAGFEIRHKVFSGGSFEKSPAA
ncbi:MAG: NAD-dependent epimerase/dehydratase family protein [bacterium]